MSTTTTIEALCREAGRTATAAAAARGAALRALLKEGRAATITRAEALMRAILEADGAPRSEDLYRRLHRMVGAESDSPPFVAAVDLDTRIGALLAGGEAFSQLVRQWQEGTRTAERARMLAVRKGAA